MKDVQRSREPEESGGTGPGEEDPTLEPEARLDGPLTDEELDEGVGGRRAGMGLPRSWIVKNSEAHDLGDEGPPNA